MSKKLAHGAEDLGALDEDVADFEVGEEVDVALAVAQFDVGQAVEFLGQGEHGLGEEGECGSTWMVSSPVRVRKR